MLIQTHFVGLPRVYLLVSVIVSAVFGSFLPLSLVFVLIFVDFCLFGVCLCVFVAVFVPFCHFPPNLRLFCLFVIILCLSKLWSSRGLFVAAESCCGHRASLCGTLIVYFWIFLKVNFI